MNFRAYLQGADGSEIDLVVQVPDPADGTKVVVLSPTSWVRIVPNGFDPILTVLDTDNRDPRATELTLSNGSKVEVNPFELFKNMIENLGEEGDEEVTRYLNELVMGS